MCGCFVYFALDELAVQIGGCTRVYELVVMLNSMNKNNLSYVYRKFELYLRPQPLQRIPYLKKTLSSASAFTLRRAQPIVIMAI
jgi:hypothetical protein